MINLPAYRPELKGSVEKFFDVIQGLYKNHLKGRGVIEPDFQERGVHDYRKDACLTMEQFEKILLYCIVFYNAKRIVDNYPFTESMITEKIQPYSNAIWNYGCGQMGANLISVTKEELIYTLLPRTTGKFTRQGLIVNGVRYKNENYTEKYLTGGETVVAYNPDDISCVWLLESGIYTCFKLIERRFKGSNLPEVQLIQEEQKRLVKENTEQNLQAKVALISHIEAVVSTVNRSADTNITGIRRTRNREKNRTHVDYIQKVGVCNE